MKLIKFAIILSMIFSSFTAKVYASERNVLQINETIICEYLSEMEDDGIWK